MKQQQRDALLSDLRAAMGAAAAETDLVGQRGFFR